MYECPFLVVKRIDSFQKLGLVLWLDRHGDAPVSLLELADQAFFADLSLLERSLAELSAAGLIDSQAGRYRMIHSPEIDYCLACLTESFESPLARQGILACVTALGGGRDVRFD